MFKNIGNKIKVLAKVLFVLEVIIVAFYFFAQLKAYDALSNVAMMVTFVLVLGFFILVFWTKNVVLYALGELVDNSSEIKKDLEITREINELLLMKINNIEKNQNKAE